MRVQLSILALALASFCFPAAATDIIISCLDLEGNLLWSYSYESAAEARDAMTDCDKENGMSSTRPASLLGLDSMLTRYTPGIPKSSF